MKNFSSSSGIGEARLNRLNQNNSEHVLSTGSKRWINQMQPVTIMDWIIFKFPLQWNCNASTILYSSTGRSAVRILQTLILGKASRHIIFSSFCSYEGVFLLFFFCSKLPLLHGLVLGPLKEYYQRRLGLYWLVIMSDHL